MRRRSVASTRNALRRRSRRAGAAPSPPPEGLIGGSADYSVGDLIGLGVLGPERQGRYLPTGVSVVLESVPEAMRTDATFKPRLEEMSREASHLRARAIVGVYDLLLDAGGAMYLVTEAAGEATLEAQVPQGTGIELDQAQAVADGVLAALESLHAEGLTHGGLSRRTVYRGDDGRIRLGSVPSAALLAEYTGAAPSVRGDLAAASALFAEMARAPLPGRASRRSLPRRLHTLTQRRFDSAAAMRAALAEGPQAAWIRPAAVEAGAAPRRGRRWLGRASVGAAAVAAGVLLGLGLNAAISPSAASGSLQIHGVTLAVNPASSCDVPFSFTAVGEVQGQGTVVYRWDASGGRSSGPQTLVIGGGQRSFSVTQSWRPPPTQGQASMSFEILQPSPFLITRTVTARCP